MRTYTLTHLADCELLIALRRLVAQERAATASLIAHIAEVDSRRLYAPAGYPSMFEYCVRELRLSEQAALKRIRAGRAARKCPALFDALAEGRIHLSGIVLLAPWLTTGNANELLAMATHRTAAEIERCLAGRYPRPDMPTRLAPIASPARDEAFDPSAQLSSRTVEACDLNAQLSSRTVDPANSGDEVSTTATATLPDALSSRTVEALASSFEPQAPYARLKPLASERFGLQVTISEATHDKIQYVRSLLGHRVPSVDLAQVLDLALDALVRDLEKHKCAATSRPRGTARPAAAARTIPARVRRAVWQRDQGRCTFVGESGHRCQTRRMLEFDHVDLVSRGGRASVEGLRLRCRTHNLQEAEKLLGAAFMRAKQEAARNERASRREHSTHVAGPRRPTSRPSNVL